MGEGLPDPGGSGEHRHDRGWSIARMIDSRAAATRMVDMIAKVDRWVSAPWCQYHNWPIEVIWQIAIINTVNLLRCP
jgi:hypothetical protein